MTLSVCVRCSGVSESLRQLINYDGTKVSNRPFHSSDRRFCSQFFSRREKDIVFFIYFSLPFSMSQLVGN